MGTSIGAPAIKVLKEGTWKIGSRERTYRLLSYEFQEQALAPSPAALGWDILVLGREGRRVLATWECGSLRWVDSDVLFYAGALELVKVADEQIG